MADPRIDVRERGVDHAVIVIFGLRRPAGVEQAHFRVEDIDQRVEVAAEASSTGVTITSVRSNGPPVPANPVTCK